MIKRIAAVLAVSAALFSFGFDSKADATCHGLSYTPQPFAKEKIIVSSASLGFTSATYAPTGEPAAAYAYVTIETNSIRIQSTGADPTATDGHLIAANQAFEVCGVPAVRNLRMIRVTADATAQATYFR